MCHGEDSPTTLCVSHYMSLLKVPFWKALGLPVIKRTKETKTQQRKTDEGKYTEVDKLSLVCRTMSIFSLFLFLKFSIMSIHSFNNVNNTTLEESKVEKGESASRKECFLTKA